MRGALLAAALLIALLTSGASAARAAPSADSLYHRALERLAQGGLDAHRAALADLDEAALVAPKRADLQQALARTYADAGQLARARKCLERVAKLAPDDPATQLALGLSWKWEWLASLEGSSYSRAVECLTRAARLSPRTLEARLALVALALVRGNDQLGTLAAQSALLLDPGSPEALLALGCTAYRSGALGLADSAFRSAFPRLPPEVRRRFTDLSTVAGDRAPGPDDVPADPADMEDAFWRSHDPDLTTPENEAELNFMARVAHALLLFRDERGVRWDMRAELFARYGIPDSIQLHPPQAVLEYSVTRYVHNEYAPPPIYFPYNEQIWSYTGLGMRVVLWDRSLHQVYELPVVHDYDNDPRPDPAAIAARPDLVLLGGGRGVYRALPPGVTPMAVRAQIARFPADSGARLVAILEAPGGPTETLQGSWAVVTAEGRKVARGSGALSVSACEPGELRFANFDVEVPPGDYRVDVAVADGHGRRGVAHLRTAVAHPSGPLALSDLVLLCGPQAAASEGSAIRIEPSFERRLGGARSVAVYFEVDHLAVGQGGASRFAYTYAIRPAGKPRGPRPERVFEATREEENVGPHRRQFVSAPLQSLAAGTYDFEIAVRDLVSGASVEGSIRFTRE